MKTLINFKSVLTCKLYWINQERNIWSDKEPTLPTVRGLEIPTGDRAYARAHTGYPLESVFQRAVRLDILDVWTAECKIVMNSRVTIVKTGDEAVAFYHAWRKSQYSKGKNIK